MNEIWVLRPGALGDTILTLPLLKALIENYPHEKIIFWGSTEYAAVIQKFYPSILFRSFQSSEIMPLFSCDFTPADLKITLPKKIFAVLKKDKLLENNFNRICSQIEWCEITEKNNSWVADQLFLLAKQADKNNFSPAIHQPLEPKILLHIGTGSPAKLLPVEFWQMIIKKLPAHVPITFLLGPAEKNFPIPDVPAQNILANISLHELMRTMNQFSFYLGLDSGVSHLAGVMGLNGFAFFHATNPQCWRPLGKIKPLVVNPKAPDTWENHAFFLCQQLKSGFHFAGN